MKKFYINQKQLAERIGVTPHTISNWKKTKPELIKLIELGLKAEESIAKSGNIKLENIKINGSVSNVNIGNHNKIMINNQDICVELCKELAELPKEKQKKLFHKFMGMILDEKDKK